MVCWGLMAERLTVLVKLKIYKYLYYKKSADFRMGGKEKRGKKKRNSGVFFFLQKAEQKGGKKKREVVRKEESGKIKKH